MNKDIFKGKWNEIKGKAKQRWAELSEEEIEKVQGKYEELAGLLQKKYGYEKDRAEKAIEEFMKDKKDKKE